MMFLLSFVVVLSVCSLILLIVCMSFTFSLWCVIFFFYVSGNHRDLHVLTHSFPTRRSSDLEPAGIRFLPTPHAHAEPGAVLKAGPRLFRSAAAFPPLRRCPAQQIFRLRKLGAVHSDQSGRDILRTALLQQASRSEEHTSELQSLMRISYAVFCLKKKK